MKKWLLGLVSVVAATTLVACSATDTSDKASTKKEGDKLEVVASYSIIADMVENVGGDKVNVTSIVTRGTDPHMYEPTPEDTLNVEKADILFYNGMNLETGKGWFKKLLENARKEDVAFLVTEGIEPEHLTEEGKENEEDPHAWLSLANGMIYVDNITKRLIEIDPDNKDYYEKNHDRYQEKLAALHEEAKEKMAAIPEEQRILVTSEGAFKYFSKAYDLRAEYIWEINTDNQGTPEQMTRITDIVNSGNVKALFVETSVSPKTMKAVAAQTKVDIYDTVFTDSLAKEGETGDTYYDMMKWNINTIHDGLTQE